MKEYIINGNDAGQRLDKFISKTLKTLPQSLLYKAIRTKKIKVNRKRAEPGTVLQAGDSVLCFLSPEFFDEKYENDPFLTLTPDLCIVYEDGNVIVCDKRPGLLCHPDDHGEQITLIEHIKAYLYRKGEYDPENENSFVPSLCNRIDRNTGGLVIAAKNAAALRDMNEMIRQKTVSKFYLCAVHGIPQPPEATLTAYLYKDTKNNTVTVYDKPKQGRVKIVTGYKVLKKKNGNSLLEVRLFTGKTHQIRSHLSYMGHPLLGDGKYGVNRDDKKLGYKYQALYSYKLCFDRGLGDLSYLTGKTLSVDEDNIWFYGDFR
ncbi:MAG: RluA family pseudouridine synthase [Clostridia bacterium]|nr:RluA family pseudouridine synthase [Clostridia bacterium]